MTQPPSNPKTDIMNTIADAQYNMRKGYALGSLGALVSGIVWLVSALVAHEVSSQTAIWTLFFGGMLIHPLSLLLGKILSVPAKHSKGNALGNLAMEGTFFMLLCIPLALLLSQQNHAWFFQGMLLIIGGRYLTFSTLYGLKVYWLLGGALAIVAFVLFGSSAPSSISALIGSTIEIGFGIYLFSRFQKGKA